MRLKAQAVKAISRPMVRSLGGAQTVLAAEGRDEHVELFFAGHCLSFALGRSPKIATKSHVTRDEHQTLRMGVTPYGHDRREYCCETMGRLLLAVKLRA